MCRLALLGSGRFFQKPKLKNHRMNHFRNLLAVICLLLMVGCGGEKIQKAGGRVLVDGKPVTGGQIEFYPAEGGRSAVATILDDGSFVVSYRKPGDGLPVGDYKVTIVSDIFEPKPAAKKSGEDISTDEFGLSMVDGRLIHVVPKIYNAYETTPLRQSVTKSSGAQSFTFDIPSGNN